MSATRHEVVGGYAPLDNVQRFERLKADAIFLQTMADFLEDPDTINVLTEGLDTSDLKLLPVNIHGGRIQVPAIGDEQETVNNFVANKEVVFGEYRGVSWRAVPTTLLSTALEYHLCHAIVTDVDVYYDDEGKHHRVENFTYITIADSEVEILSQVGSHDFRHLAKDGFTLKLDQIILDETLDLTSKLATIAKMFGEFHAEDGRLGPKRDMLQRLSYLNHLGLFDDMIAVVPFVYARDDEATTVLSNSKGPMLAGTVRAMGIDHPLAMGEDDLPEVQEGSYVLCLELEVDGCGTVSAPYVSGVTQIYNTKPVD